MKKPLALIIEDDQDIAKVFASVMDQADYDAEIIHAGDRALERLAEVVPDLVLLDLRLPVVSGKEILTQIHLDKRLSKTRTVIVTANPDMAQDLPESTPFVLLKPVDVNQLRALAKRLDPRTTATTQ
jgi:DNA-binding response OmpR family regulator